MKISKYLFIIFIILLGGSLTGQLNAQNTVKFDPYGDVRLLYSGSTTDAHGFGGDAPFMRIRAGYRIILNENHGFAARAAYMVTRDIQTPDFSLTANGNLAGDTFSFDEFYYHYKDDKQQLKVGRFQKSFSLPTATANSITRFQSSSVSINWSDGLFYQSNLIENWVLETVFEFQKQRHLSFPYKGTLNFSRHRFNWMGYLGATHKNRDKLNFIEKTIALMWSPDTYWYNGRYTSYLSLSGNAVLDIPLRKLQGNSSLRFTGELGQNLMSSFENGTVTTLSAGIYNFAERHNLMIEAAWNDSEWLTAPYKPNSDTYEIRYSLKLLSNLVVDLRYQINKPRDTAVSNMYSTFGRATYSF